MKLIIHEGDIEDLRKGLHFTLNTNSMLRRSERVAMHRLLWQLERRSETPPPTSETVGGGHAA